MKKRGFSFRNIYRVLIMRPGKLRRVVCISQESPHPDMGLDAFLKKTIQDDRLKFEAGCEISKMLEKRVIRRGKSFVTKNSLAEVFFPFFSFQYIELKMAAITLMLVFTLGTGPAGIRSVNRNICPSFLADTLIDSSGLIYSHHSDTVLPCPR